jgi:hypothetical protein
VSPIYRIPTTTDYSFHKPWLNALFTKYVHFLRTAINYSPYALSFFLYSDNLLQKQPNIGRHKKDNRTICETLKVIKITSKLLRFQKVLIFSIKRLTSPDI